MSSSMRWRKGVMGRWIFMARLLALRELTSVAWHGGHAIDAGVIVRWREWDNEEDAGHRRRCVGGVFYQRVGERFSSILVSLLSPHEQVGLPGALLRGCAVQCEATPCPYCLSGSVA